MEGFANAEHFKCGNALRLYQHAGAERRHTGVLFKNCDVVPGTGKRNSGCQAGSASADDSDPERIAIWHHLITLDDARPLGLPGALAR